MTRESDIAAAVSLGVDAVGFIFYPASPRAVTLEQAKSLLTAIPPFVAAVAVLVNPDAALVQQILRELPIHYLQFHGAETPEFCQQFAHPYIKAVPASSPESINQAMQQYTQAKALLVDTPSLQHGGSGQSFNWETVPKHRDKPLILAGGLHAGNIKAAIASCHPYAVDVCSGVEAAPGIKDLEKMKAFITSLGDNHVV